MKHSEVSHPDGEVTIGPLHHVEHNAVTWTVHWLEAVLFVSLLDEEDVLSVLKVVAARLPQFGTVDVWRKNLTVSSDFVF